MPLRSIDPTHYETQLTEKVSEFKRLFSALEIPEPAVFASAPLHYRLRAEFRMWHQGDSVDYAMFAPDDPKRPIVITHFPVADASICTVMARLREKLNASLTLRHRLFQANFFATLSGEQMITLIYHQPLDETWESAARELATELNVHLIGRSRKQKIVLSRDWLSEEITLGERCLQYRQIEGSFSQPNGGVNQKMLGWACQQAAGLGGDLLELYCGNGNFTVALAPYFRQVLATEVSKSSVAAAHHNLSANHITNVAMARMSSDEISTALARRQAFNRMKDINLDDYNFSTLFVDPPRSGLDASTLELAQGFEYILYISCNPTSLLENMLTLQKTHKVTACAAFDQFPYTSHLECGLLLKRR